QELTRVGMGVNEMAEVASLYARVLLKDEDSKHVRDDVQHLKSDFQHVQYCFDSESIPAYEGM
ncbi:MAG: serine hydroxymethyltransferase, partial [Candidatus Poseidoniaceae archaeon]